MPNLTTFDLESSKSTPSLLSCHVNNDHVGITVDWIELSTASKMAIQAALKFWQDFNIQEFQVCG